VPLPAPASVDSSRMPLVDTSESPASKSVWDFKYVYTRRQKVPSSEPTPADPSPVDNPYQPSASLFDLDVFIAFVKVTCLALIILFQSSFSMIIPFNLTFHQFALFVPSE